MKKKHLANLIMVAIILMIAAAGVLGVGYFRGWFDADNGSTAVLVNVRGIVDLERSGVSCPAEKGTVLRAGDRLLCAPGTTATVQTADGTFTMSDSAQIEITAPAADSFAAKVTTGEVFIHTGAAVFLSFGDQEVEVRDAAALLSIRSGAQSISVFYGSVANAAAGQTLEWVNGEKTVSTLEIESLNDFAIDQLRAANETAAMCFATAELDQLKADRWTQKLEQLAGTQPSVTEPPMTEPPVTEPLTTEPPVTEPPTTEPPVTEPPATEPPVTEPPATEPPVTEPPTTEPPVTEPPATEPPVTEPPTTEPPVTEPPTTEPPVTEPPATEPPVTEPPVTEPPVTEPPATEPPAPVYDGHCTITIRCDTILDNWDELDPAKAGYVPADGVILPVATVGFYQGETVFDVLKRVCTVLDIQIEYSWTPMYDSYYIEGINHLYEFDCGFESGWMYKVNGWFPNYGCSSYTLQGGEEIVWCYTCVGLGADVGGGSW